MDMTERKREAAFVALVTLCAFLLRYWHLTSFGWVADGKMLLAGMRTTTYSLLHFSDADVYGRLARDFLEGRGLSMPFTPPGTTLLLAAVYKILGYDFFTAKTVYAAMGALAIPAIYFTGRELLGKPAARDGIMLCAISFTLIFITGGLNTENVYLFATAWAAALFTAIYREKYFAAAWPGASAFAFGIVAGASLLSRSEFALMLLGFLILGIARPGWPAAKKMRIAAATAAGIALLVLPWTARNYFYLTEFNKKLAEVKLPVIVPVAMNGPFNFLEGHNPSANGTYSPAVTQTQLEYGYFVNLDYNNPDHLRMVRDGYVIGWRYLLEHPAHELAMLPVKLAVFANGFANGVMLGNFPCGLTGTVESAADSFVPDSKIALWAGMPLALIGVLALWRRREAGYERWIIVLPLVATFATMMIFYGLSRMVFPALPYYYLLMAAGIEYLWRATGLRPARTEAAFFGAVLLLMAAGWLQSREITVVSKTPAGNYGKYHVDPLRPADWMGKNN